VATIQDFKAILIYRVGPVLCCSPCIAILSINHPAPLTKLPGQKSQHSGIFKYKSTLVNVCELRKNFGVEPEQWLDPGRIIITELTTGNVGFWVDEIIDVIEPPADGWGKPPALIPQATFSRTLTLKNEIHLYAEFDKLYAIKQTGYLKSYIEFLKKLKAKTNTKNLINNKLIRDTNQSKQDNDNKKLEPNVSSVSILSVSAIAKSNNNLSIVKDVDNNLNSKSEKKPIPDQDSVQVSVHKSQTTEKYKSKKDTVSKPLNRQQNKNITTLNTSNTKIIKPFNKTNTPLEFTKPISRQSKKSIVHNISDSLTSKKELIYTQKNISKTEIKQNKRDKINTISTDSDFRRSTANTIKSTSSLKKPITNITSNTPSKNTIFSNKIIEKQLMENSTLTSISTVSSSTNSAGFKKKYVADKPSSLGFKTQSAQISSETDNYQNKIKSEYSYSLSNENQSSNIILFSVLILFFLITMSYLYLELYSNDTNNYSNNPTIKNTKILDQRNITDNRMLESPSNTFSATQLTDPDYKKEFDNKQDVNNIAQLQSNKTQNQHKPIELSDEIIPSNQKPTTIKKDVKKTIRSTAHNDSTYSANISKNPDGITIILHTPIKISKSLSNKLTTDNNLISRKEIRIEDSNTILKNKSQFNTKQSIQKISPSTISKEIIHIVVKGDTLWHIAQFYVDDPYRYPELARLSNIKNPDLIYPGNRVHIIQIFNKNNFLDE